MSKYMVDQPKPRYDYLAWASLLLLSFNIYHSRLMDIVGLYSQSVTVLIQGVAIVLLLFYLMTEKKLNMFSIQFGAIEYLLLLSLTVIIIFSRDIAGNFTYIIRYAVYIFVVVLMKYDKKLMHIAFRCLLIAGLLHVVFTYWFYFDTDFYLSKIFPHFNSAQREHLYRQVVYNKHAIGMSSNYSQNGIYISIALCCTFTLLHGQMSARKRLLYGVIFLINAVALFMTGKRAVAVFVCFAMVATYMICGRQKTGRRLVIALLTTSAVLMILYVLSFYNESIAATLSRFLKTIFQFSTQDISNGRFDLYRIGWDFFRESPIIGIGWREFTNEVSAYYRGSEALRDTHNVFLQLLCETGIVGCSMFLGVFGTALVKTIGYAVGNLGRYVIEDPDMKMLIFSLCYQIYFLGYCMTGNPLYDLETLFGYMIALGIIGCIDYRYGWRSVARAKVRVKSKYIIARR